MNQLTKTQIWIMNIGALLMLFALVANLFFPVFPPLTYPLLFLAGAMGFGCMQMLQRYEGKNFVIRRLRRLQILSDIMLILTGFFMLLPYMGVFHIPYIHLGTARNEWLIPLVIAALLQLYTVFRLPNELEKEQ